MEYTKLGNTDITISKICVGCMSFGKAGIMHDWTLDEAKPKRLSSMLWIWASTFLIRQTAILPARANVIWDTL